MHRDELVLKSALVGAVGLSAPERVLEEVQRLLEAQPNLGSKTLSLTALDFAAG